MEANRNAAADLLAAAHRRYSIGDKETALRLAQKSLRMFASAEAQQLADLIDGSSADNLSKHSADGTLDADDGANLIENDDRPIRFHGQRQLHGQDCHHTLILSHCIKGARQRAP